MTRFLLHFAMVGVIALAIMPCGGEPNTAEVQSFRALIADYSRTSGGYSPAVSPDGKTIAYMSSEGEIWILPAVDLHSDQYTEPWRLAFTPEDNGQLAPSFFDLRHARNLDWSPDGKRLAIAYLDGRLYVAEMFNFDSKTARVRTITADRQVDARNNRAFALGMPRWSPDGTHIAFARETDNGRASVLIADVSTRTATKIADDAVSDSMVWGQPWSPDGKWLAYGSTKGVQGSNRAMVVSMDGQIRLVASSGPSSCPDWAQTSGKLAFSTDKETVLKLGADLGVVAFYTAISVSDRNGEGDRLLIRPGAPSAAQTDLARKEALSRVRDRLLSEFASALTTGQKQSLKSSRMGAQEMCNLACLVCARSVGGGVKHALEGVAGKDLQSAGGNGSVSAALQAAMKSREIPDRDKDNFIRKITGFLSGITPAQWQSQFESDSGPVWSPDGKKIAFVRSNRILDQQRLCTLDVATGREREVFRTREIGCVNWSRDGKLLVLQSRRLMGVNTSLDNALQVQRIAIPGYPEIWMLQVVPDVSSKAIAQPAPSRSVEAAAPASKAVSPKIATSPKLQFLYICPGRIGLLAGAKHRFVPIGLDSDGNEMPIASKPIWKSDSKAGSIGPDGTFTASGSVGAHNNAITVTIDGKTATATIEILPNEKRGGYVLESVMGDPIPGALNWPIGVAVDSSGFVYVADYYGGDIQKFDPSGKPLETWCEWGGDEYGQRFPSGVATDKNGTVFVADYLWIRVFDSSGRFLRKWDYVRKPIPDNTGGPRLVCDKDGDLYMTDPVISAVVKYDANGKLLAQWGSRGAGNGQLEGPAGIALDSKGFVYVCDAGNHRVQKFDLSGNYVGQWGSRGDGEGQFERPTAIAIDKADRVYVADSSRVQVFTVDGVQLKTIGGHGSQPGQFASPEGIAIDHSGCILVSDTENNRLQKFSPEGKFLGFYGIPRAANGIFCGQPDRLAVDTHGCVYVGDNEFTTMRTQRFDSSGTYSASFHGGVLTGVDRDGNCYLSGRDMQVTRCSPSGEVRGKFKLSDDSGLISPADVGALDSENCFWVICYDGKVARLDINGGVKSSFLLPGATPGAGSEIYPWSIAVAPDGGTYVSYQPRAPISAGVGDGICRFDRQGNVLSSWKEGEGPLASLNVVGTLAVDKAGDLYTASFDADKNIVILKLDQSGKILDRIPASESFIRRIAVGPDGRVYALSMLSGRLKVFAPVSQQPERGSGPSSAVGRVGQLTEPKARIMEANRK